MYLLYIDESGSVADASQKYFILAGVAVHEFRTHWIEQDLNQIAARFYPEDPHSLELHGSPMRSGQGGWRVFSPEKRVDAMKEALDKGIVRQSRKSVTLFGAVIKKSSLSAEDPVEHAFEQLSSRFDLFLKRLYHKHDNSQRGLLLFDKSSTEQRIQSLAREFKYSGGTWGKTKNYAEVPVFLDSRASRLIQLADLVSYSLFRFFEHNDNTYYDVIKHCFDSEGGVQHGFYTRF